MSDNEDFKKRLQFCVEKVGTLYALAKKAGLPTNTLRRYFDDSEPSRTKLIAIAHAAEVSVQWLATGDDLIQKQVAEVQENATWTNGFKKRLKVLIEKHGGPKALCSGNYQDPAPVTAFLETDQISASLVEMLAGNRALPIRWLIVGESDWEIANAEYGESRQKASFWHAIDAIDERRLLNGELSVGRYVENHWEWRDPVFNLLEEIYKQLPPSNYRIVTYYPFDECELASSGDSLVVDQSASEHPQNGIYAYSRDMGGGDGFYLCRHSEVGGVVRVLFTNGASHVAQPTSDKCIGRVLLIIRKFV
jgi:lambda repressor-like predicted transcriptional regulator